MNYWRDIPTPWKSGRRSSAGGASGRQGALCRGGASPRMRSAGARSGAGTERRWERGAPGRRAGRGGGGGEGDGGEAGGSRWTPGPPRCVPAAASGGRREERPGRAAGPARAHVGRGGAARGIQTAGTGCGVSGPGGRSGGAPAPPAPRRVFLRGVRDTEGVSVGGVWDPPPRHRVSPRGCRHPPWGGHGCGDRG